MKPRHIWVDKFHPKNGRLALYRLTKLSIADLKIWIALGRKEIRRYTLRDEWFLQYRSYGQPPVQISMRQWCEQKVGLLLRVLDRSRS